MPADTAARNASATDPVSLATRPATTEQIANTDPQEISISPVRMTSIEPIATISTGRLDNSRSRRLPGAKYAGATIAITIASAPNDAATAVSRAVTQASADRRQARAPAP